MLQCVEAVPLSLVPLMTVDDHEGDNFALAVVERSYGQIAVIQRNWRGYQGYFGITE